MAVQVANTTGFAGHRPIVKGGDIRSPWRIAAAQLTKLPARTLAADSWAVTQRLNSPACTAAAQVQWDDRQPTLHPL